MKRARIAAALFFLLPATSMFASVVVGDNTPVFTLGVDFLDSNQSLAQSFTLTSDSTVNEVVLSFNLFLLSHTTGAYPITIHITNGLAVGSQEFLTLNESISLPSTTAVTPLTYGFPAITLPAGTYYLIVTSSFVQPPVLEWLQNELGSPVVGSLGPAYFGTGAEFGPGWQVLPAVCYPVGVPCTTNGTLAFDLDFARPIIHIPVTGAALNQLVALTVVAGPAVVPPGAPVEASLGFVDLNGNIIGPGSQVSLLPGQMSTLELHANDFVNQFGERVEVRPVVTQISTDPTSPSLQASVEVVDSLTRFGTVLATAPAAAKLSSVPVFVPQGLAGGQTMRLNVAAYPPGPCTAQLSFADKDGNPLGGSTPVNLSPGAATFVDLSADSLGLQPGQRIEVQPIISVVPSISAGPPIPSSCEGSVEVFDRRTGRTSTYQTERFKLPAVQ